MAGTIMPSPWFTGLDDNGVSVVGGKLYTYAAGTSTPLATWSDVDLQVPNSNPVILDGGGRATVYLSPTSYKFVLKDANDVTIRSQDTIVATAPFTVDLDIAGVAGENLPAGAVVYLSSGLPNPVNSVHLAGRWYLADADFNYASVDASFIGLVPVAMIAGATGAIRLQGRTHVPGPLTIGAAYYVSTVAGGLVTPAPIAPAFTRVVGVADSLTTIVSASGFAGASVTPGDFNVSGNLTVSQQATFAQDVVLAGNNSVRRNTLDGADSGFLNLSGGGGPFGSPHDWTRGAFIQLFGNEAALLPGVLVLGAGDAPLGAIQFYSTPGSLRGQMFASGGFSWGSSAFDPGPNNFNVLGTIECGGTINTGGNLVVAGGVAIHGSFLSLSDTVATAIAPGTADGADTLGIAMSGGGAVDTTRGGLMLIFGNEHPTNPGIIQLAAGDPGFIRCNIGQRMELRTLSAGAATMLRFVNAASATVGSIETDGVSTAYLTTCDASLKDDLAIVRHTDVLERTVVHLFRWKTDGALGTGVFAQEVQGVLPSAVSRVEGAPLGVDYSKFVPELIVGWQQHEARMRTLLERLERVESRHDG